jgi:CubicO group peptidase (beta-lactamase class C family)
MKRFALANLIVLLGFAVPSRGDAPFVELDGRSGFHTSNAPADAVKLLKSVAKDNEIKCFAFAPNGDWLFLFGGNGLYTSNTDLPACKKIAEISKNPTEFTCAAFSPGGGWTLFWGQNGSWTEGSVPDEAFKKIGEVTKRGGTLRSVAYGAGGAWVLLFDKAGASFGNCPKELAEVLSNAVKDRVAVRCVAFVGKDWICLSDNGWWSSNLSLPESKFIDSEIKRGVSPKWIAVKPGSGPHDFARWAQMMHETYDGKLTGGYGFEVRDHGKIVASGAEGWARTSNDAPAAKWTMNKPMGVASVSKTVTAVALLKLWEESENTAHKFTMDDPFWPHIKSICPKASADVKKVTLRQLLTHRTGFRTFDDCATPATLEKLLEQPLAHPAGTHYEYSNNNFYVARLVIEQIGHVEYTPYVKEHVLAPMGITKMETHFQAKAPMCGYGKLNEGRPGFPFDWETTASAGAAGWFGSVSDLGLFLDGLREHKVLSESTTAMMNKDGLGWDQFTTYWEKNGGWDWDEGGTGRKGELHSTINRFPDDVDVVILCNCAPPVGVEEMALKCWTEARKD